jgi:hypothetical protein
MNGKTEKETKVELNSIDADLTRIYAEIDALPPRQRERAIQFYAAYLAYLIRLYQKQELPLGRYTNN